MNSWPPRYLHRKVVLFGCIGVISYFLFITAFTRSTFFGDTPDYVRDIAATFANRAPTVSLLDFGHLTWRPIGKILTSAPTGQDTPELRNQIARNLIAVNLVSAALGALAFWLLLSMADGIKPFGAILALVTLLTTNGFILLSRSGTAWIPGLTCDLAACCLAVEGVRRRSSLMAVMAGILAAIAALFWVPYVLAVPIVVAASLLVARDRKAINRLCWSALRIVPVAAILTLAAYIVAIDLRHISNWTEFLAWMRTAGHGEGRNRQLLRMFFGFPRSFFIAGDDGVLWKQFLFHDPYAGVRTIEVLKASLWRVGLFYAALGMLLLELIRRLIKQRDQAAFDMLLWFCIAACPTLALAILFEAGSVERYLALYGAFFVTVAWVTSQPSTLTITRLVMTAFCVALIVNNLYENWGARIDRERVLTMTRLGEMQSSALKKPVDILTINVHDDLWNLYDPTDRSLDLLPPMSPLIPSTAGDIGQWKQLFAKGALRAWSSGGQVWVSKRCWAAKPMRMWLWVEGDDDRVHWRDIPQLVSRFKVDAETGGGDGFNRLAHTSESEQISRDLLQAPVLSSRLLPEFSLERSAAFH